MILACAAALAASWSIGVRLERAVEPDGTLVLPAGVAVRLVVTGGAVSVSEADGRAVPVNGVAGGVLVPASATRRLLRVEADGATHVRVHWSDDPGEAAAWEAWEVAAARAIRRAGGDPAARVEGEADADAVPTPPWGGGRLRAAIQLRADAVDDVPTAWLGLLHDTAAVRPVTATTYVTGAERSADVPVALTGPGVAIVRTRPPAGPLTRYTLTPVLDGHAGAPLDVASAGSAPVGLRVWIPPGRHTLALTTTEAGVVTTVAPATLRGRLLGPRVGAGGGDVGGPGDRGGTDDAPVDLAAAERAFLTGDPDTARQGFAAAVDAPGAAGELARARLVALAEDPAAALAVATSHPRGPLAAEVLADAVLARADRLPPADVLAAVLAARDPDPVALARWMDGLGGLRPRGLALLDLAAVAAPVGPSLAVRAVREAAASTWWSRVAPPADAVATVLHTPEGPGIPRVRLGAGVGAVTVSLPALPGGRVPVLRLEAPGPVRFTVDGAPYTSGTGGTLDVALPVGPHVVTVAEGTLLLLDADLATGGERVYEWGAVALPARWELPDPGVAVDLRVQVDPPGPVTLGFDDGRELTLVPDPDGTLPGVHAGSLARAVEVRAAPGSRAGLTMRAARVDRPAPAPLAPIDPEAGLAELARLSAAVDAGVPGARAERAEVLGRLGLLTAARRDLTVLLGDPASADAAVALAERVTPPVPGADVPGPHSVAAAFAAAGDARATLPDDPAALLAAATATRQPWLAVAAAEAWLARGALPHALVAIDAATALSVGEPEAAPAPPASRDAGAALAASTAARIRWEPLTRADASAGLVPVARAPEPPGADAPLWRRAADAMLPSPWPDDPDLVLRGDGSGVLRFRGERAEVELVCRDEVGPGAPCDVAVRWDAETRRVRVPDGATPTRIAFAGPIGAHELEVSGPGRGRAVRMRVRVDGKVLPPRTERLALRAAPGRPVVLDVASPAVLRVEVARGAVSVGGTTVAPGAPLVLPLTAAGRAHVVITGDGDVLLATGTLLPPLSDAAWPDTPPPPPAAALPLDALAPLYARVAHPPEPARILPGDGGTFRLALSARHTLLSPPVEPWDAGELEAAWMRAGPAGWAYAAGWARGPRWAAGAEAETGRTWKGGWAGLSVRGGMATGVVEEAGSVAVALDARHDLPIGPLHDLRLTGRLAAGWWSPAPAAPVDPRAWTRWSADHPAYARLGAAWRAAPWRDVRTELGATVTSNTGPTLDAAALHAGVDVLVGGNVVVDAALTARWRFADDHRAAAGGWIAPTVGVEWARWLSEGERVTLWARGGLPQGGPEASGGVAVWWTGGRGLHDLPPDATRFRAARGHP